MSRQGDCWDNSVAGSFFSTLKAELVDNCRYATHDQATDAIAEYIESFYNPVRRHSYLGYNSPIEFELKSQTLEQHFTTEAPQGSSATRRTTASNSRKTSRRKTSS